jgi:TolA-binding protein
MPERTRTRARATALALIASVAFAAFAAFTAIGCGTVGGNTFVRAFAAGDRAYGAGRFAEAAHAYEEAAKVAERDRDKEEALFAAADALHRGGDDDGALRIFDQLAAARPAGERTFYAAFRAARIRIARGQVKEGYAALTKVFTEAPEVGVAHQALRKVVRHVEETEGKAAALQYEVSLYASFEGNRLGEEILYDVSLRKIDIGDANGALDGFLKCADKYPYPGGALFDDALFHASLLHEQLGDAKAAIEDLRRLLAVREQSDFNGTYDRPRMGPAQFRIAELQRDKLSDHAAARASFRRVYDDFPRSLLRPKALYFEAKLAHDDGDANGACAVAKKLLDEFPDTRWARKADDTCTAVKDRAEALRKARAERRKKGLPLTPDDD